MNATSLEIWPEKARKILDSKNINIEELRDSFTNIWFPWDEGYDTKRTFYSLRVQNRPLFIIKPISVPEIETILNYLKVNKLTVRIVNGRHSCLLNNFEVIVDVSYFTEKSLVYVNEGNILIAGAGNTQGQLNDFLFREQNTEYLSHFGSFGHPRGMILQKFPSKLVGLPNSKEEKELGFPGGSTASVGSSGISSIGGVGSLCRTYGLTVDHVLSYTITLPPTENENSKTIIANQDQNTDLYWALRGGGANNFGILTEVTYSVISVPSIVVYHFDFNKLNKKEKERVLEFWGEQPNFKEKEQKPYYLNEDIVLYSYMGERGMELTGLYVNILGKNEKQIKKEIKKLYCEILKDDKLKYKIKLSIFPEKKYSDLYKERAEGREYFNFSFIQPLFTDEIDAKNSVSLIEDYTGSNYVIVGYTLLGGKISDKGRSETAFYPRKKKFFTDIAGFWNEPCFLTESWCYNAIDKLLKKEDYVYVGFPFSSSFSCSSKVSPKVYYGGNTSRLLSLKAHYDPLNILTASGTL